MGNRYYIYNMDLLIGTIQYKGNAVAYVNISCTRDCFRLKQFKFNAGLEDKTVEEAAHFNVFKTLVECRVFERHRVDIGSILTALNVPYYDPWLIFVATKGMCVDDCIWISERNDVGQTFFTEHIFGDECLKNPID